MTHKQDTIQIQQQHITVIQNKLCLIDWVLVFLHDFNLVSLCVFLFFSFFSCFVYGLLCVSLASCLLVVCELFCNLVFFSFFQDCFHFVCNYFRFCFDFFVFFNCFFCTFVSVWFRQRNRCVTYTHKSNKEKYYDILWKRVCVYLYHMYVQFVVCLVCVLHWVQRVHVFNVMFVIVL